MSGVCFAVVGLLIGSYRRGRSTRYLAERG